MDWFDYFGRLAPYLAGAAFLATLVLVINWHGSRLGKHDAWLFQLELRVGNLHKERAARHAQSLRIGAQSLGPPPLSEAKTVEVSEDLLLTLKTQPKARKDGPE